MENNSASSLKPDQILKILSPYYTDIQNPLKKFATVESLWNRAEYLSKEMDNVAFDVLFLGDSDYASLVLGCYNNKVRITVIENNSAQISTLKKLQSEMNISFPIYSFDIRMGLPDEVLMHLHGYGVICLDPHYTLSALALNLHRALEVINYDLGFILLSFNDKEVNERKPLAVQALCSEFKLILRNKLSLFNRYQQSPYINNTSDLLKLVPAGRVKLKKDPQIAESLYQTYSKIPIRKLYQFNLDECTIEFPLQCKIKSYPKEALINVLFCKLTEQMFLKVKNALLYALLDYFNLYQDSQILTKREAKQLINVLNLNPLILELRFIDLAPDEFISLISAILYFFKAK